MACMNICPLVGVMRTRAVVRTAHAILHLRSKTLHAGTFGLKCTQRDSRYMRGRRASETFGRAHCAAAYLLAENYNLWMRFDSRAGLSHVKEAILAGQLSKFVRGSTTW